jgi:hypothetical protein
MRRTRARAGTAILALALMTAACGGLVSKGGGGPGGTTPGHHISNTETPNHKASTGAPQGGG